MIMKPIGPPDKGGWMSPCCQARGLNEAYVGFKIISAPAVLAAK